MINRSIGILFVKLFNRVIPVVASFEQKELLEYQKLLAEKQFVHFQRVIPLTPHSDVDREEIIARLIELRKEENSDEPN